MGTKVLSENCLLGYHSMRDLNKDAVSCGWTMYNGEKNLSNDQYYYGFARAVSACDKDIVKRTMLKHEAIFKDQVYELHRLYRKQKDMMDDLKRKEAQTIVNPVGTLFSTSTLQSQVTSGDARKWNIPSFQVPNAFCARPSMSSLEDFHSPVSYRNRHISENHSLVSQDWSVPKEDAATMDFKPVKFRRKLFDLHLPAEEYIDTEDAREFKNNSICGNLKDEKQTSEKLKFVASVKDSQQDRLRCGPGFTTGANSLADLNEPIEVQELSYETQGRVANAKSSVVSKEISHYTQLGRNYVPLNNLHPEDQAGQNGWMQQVLKAGCSEDRQRAVQQNPTFHLAEPRKMHFWAERASCDTDNYARTVEISHDSRVESSVASNAPSTHDYIRSWLSSWEKPSGSSGKKLMHLRTSSVLKSPETHCSSNQTTTSGHIFPTDSNSRTSPNRGSGYQNGCYPGSYSGSKGPPSNYYDKGNGRSEKDAALEHSEERTMTKTCNRDLNKWESIFQKDANSNLQFSNHERRSEEAIRPWLRVNGGTTTATQLGDDNRIASSESLHTKKILGVPIFVKPSVSNTEVPSTGIFASGHKEDKSNGRFLDINQPAIPGGDTDDNRVKATGKKIDTEFSCLRHEIDLNLTVREEENSLESYFKGIIDLEAPAAPEDPDEGLPVDRITEKTSQSPGSSGGFVKDDKSAEELMKNAAEAIVALSSFAEQACFFVESLEENPLEWFAETIDACGADMEGKIEAYSRSKKTRYVEMDAFESMTLNLRNVTEEEYMPKPLVPDDIKLEETGESPMTASRPRRGQARRGRQRRDFQKDILPGLASLSRHEVTEDLQTFGGLMKATGYSWNSGCSSRRNGARNGRRRGRRRSVNNTTPRRQAEDTTSASASAVVVDCSLTGWGKTTRRPRRQRCPAGNPSPVILT